MYTYEDWVAALMSMEGLSPEEFLFRFGINEDDFEEFCVQAFRDAELAAAFSTGVQVAFNLLNRKGVLNASVS